MREGVLNFLKDSDGYVSGEEISRSFKISRSAIWKHMQDLRDSGYDIVAVPHLGYKLISSPDRLFAFEIARDLNTKYIGRNIHYFETVASTMDMAMELGIQGNPEGTVVLAEAQLKGRGRLGRDWSSPKYKGIYLSLILRPKILPSQAPILTLMAAVGICEAIEGLGGLEPRIKWPNDILVHSKKLAGILTELNAEMDAVRFVVIGIGINVNNDKKALLSGSTSLREQKDENINRIELLKELLRKIEANYILFQQKGASEIIQKWRGYSITLGKRVKIICQKAHLEGQATDIDADGGLLIRKDSGLTAKVMAGDVVHCR